MRSVLCALALLASATGLYLPGVTPKTFAKGEAVKIRVNRLTSTETFLPYDYYDLPFPEPEAGVKEMPENLGEYLTANRIENSPYKVKGRAHRAISSDSDGVSALVQTRF
jgi:transmembrane 9 superfamily protein 2/4